VDASAPQLDVKIKLCEHFSSCGEVRHVMVCGDGKSDSGICFASVSIRGQDVADKAKNLNGPDENIIVSSVFPTNAEHKQRVEHRTHLRNTTGLYFHHCELPVKFKSLSSFLLKSLFAIRFKDSLAISSPPAYQLSYSIINLSFSVS
ncbi:unnamed protein product, partial [Arabidopsis halleri]